jgi:hypothetical protein
MSEFAREEMSASKWGKTPKPPLKVRTPRDDQQGDVQ